MTTFNTLLQANNVNYGSNSRSPLDEWFSGILDVPIDELSVDDIARSIRQDIFLEHILPRAESILKNDPLAGEDYDGQLLYAISLLTEKQAKPVLPILKRIGVYLSQLDRSGFDSQSIECIEKIMKRFYE